MTTEERLDALEKRVENIERQIASQRPGQPQNYAAQLQEESSRADQAHLTNLQMKGAKPRARRRRR